MDLKRCYGCMAPSMDAPFCPHCGYPAGQNNDPHQLGAGTLLRDRYLVGKVLGQGGFGITYLGWDRENGEIIAIKEYFPASQVTRDRLRGDRVCCYTAATAQAYSAGKARFLREARALARLENVPAVVRIRDCFELNDTAYIVMEYVEGSDLGSYVAMRGGRLSFRETMGILSPILDALAAVHSQGLIHRDLSPDNIRLHPTRGAVLLDFGAVRDVAGADPSTPLVKSTESILKHGFAPMEQYQTRGSLGPWTDIYALCATIYYCLTGTVPPEAVSRMLGEGQLDWSMASGLTDRERGILEKGMAVTASQRYMSIGELLADLYGAPAPQVIQEAPQPPTGTRTRRPGKGRALIWSIPAGIVLILLALGIRLLIPEAPEAPERSEAVMSDSVYAQPSAGTVPASTPSPSAEVTVPSTEATASEEMDTASGFRSVYYSYSQGIAQLGIECSWAQDPIVIPFPESLGFTESTTEIRIEDHTQQELTGLPFGFQWEGSTVTVDLPERLSKGVYHIRFSCGSEDLDYVICIGEAGEYHPISPDQGTFGAGLQHVESALFLTRQEDGFLFTQDESLKTPFPDPVDICQVEYRGGIPVPSVTGETAELTVTEYYWHDSYSMFLIRLGEWYLAYNETQGLHFTKALSPDCHWYLSWQ